MSQDNPAFEAEVRANIDGLATDEELRARSLEWLIASSKHKYAYNFRWLGRPIIQYPQDILATQELVWELKPDLIIETGVAHGGSLILWASLLELLGEGRAVGIDREIRPHNREAILAHRLAPRITLIEGSSTAPEVMAQVNALAQGARRVFVVLDSNHTHAHVFDELRLYSPLVRAGGYLVVLDTIIEDMPVDFYPDRPWGRGNNPKTAVHAFLNENSRFEIDKAIEQKLLVTVAPDGYLRCMRDP